MSDSSKPSCPACTLADAIRLSNHWECAICGHEWALEETPETARVIKDANGNVLADGDVITVIKDLKLNGSQVLKAGSKSKGIRIVDGDHEIDCKVGGISYMIKACFVKKA